MKTKFSEEEVHELAEQLFDAGFDSDSLIECLKSADHLDQITYSVLNRLKPNSLTPHHITN